MTSLIFLFTINSVDGSLNLSQSGVSFIHQVSLTLVPSCHFSCLLRMVKTVPDLCEMLYSEKIKTYYCLLLPCLWVYRSWKKLLFYSLSGIRVFVLHYLPTEIPKPFSRITAFQDPRFYQVYFALSLMDHLCTDCISFKWTPFNK